MTVGKQLNLGFVVRRLIKFAARGGMALAVVGCAGFRETAAQANQTQSCAPLRLFSISGLQLRPGSELRKSAPLATPSTATPVSISVEAEAESAEMEAGASHYRWMNGRDLLTRTPPREKESFLQSLARNPFDPEFVRVKGKVISGSMVTAWKRKNPLCLIHPLVLWVAW